MATEKKFASLCEIDMHVNEILYGGFLFSDDQVESFCDYLSGKGYHMDGEEKDNALNYFLSRIIVGDPKELCSSQVMSFAESTLCSNIFKKMILNEIKEVPGFFLLKRQLQRHTDINKFNTTSLQMIEKALVSAHEKKESQESIEDSLKDSENGTLPLFQNYLLLLNGRGPRRYVKGINKSNKNESYQRTNPLNPLLIFKRKVTQK